MDTGAVTAGSASAQRSEGGGSARRKDSPRRQREQRTQFYCGNMGHLMQDCKSMQKPKVLEKGDWMLSSKSPQQDKKEQSRNSQGSTQLAAL